MIFHRSLTESKSLQVSRTFLSTLAYVNNMVIWMVSIFLLISNPPNPSSRPLGTVQSTPTTNGITMFYNFSVLWQGPNICLSFSILLFLFCGPSEQQNPQDNKFSPPPCYLTLGLVFWSG